MECPIDIFTFSILLLFLIKSQYNYLIIVVVVYILRSLCWKVIDLDYILVGSYVFSFFFFLICRIQSQLNVYYPENYKLLQYESSVN